MLSRSTFISSKVLDNGASHESCRMKTFPIPSCATITYSLARGSVQQLTDSSSSHFGILGDLRNLCAALFACRLVQCLLNSFRGTPIWCQAAQSR
jgi:hypothetical protein